jgi:CDP-diacylglycerol--inositol 3-phosphatidyltransferase
MSYHPIYCTILYGLSCLLDAVDGQAARALGQTSKFGAVLDMVTDRYVLCSYHTDSDDSYPKRCTTSCLLCYLSSAYPQYAILFQFLIALDFSSHYMHMYRYGALLLTQDIMNQVLLAPLSLVLPVTNLLQVMSVVSFGCITTIR